MIKAGHHFAEQQGYFFLKNAVCRFAYEFEKISLSLFHHVVYCGQVVLTVSIGLIADEALLVAYIHICAVAAIAHQI